MGSLLEDLIHMVQCDSSKKITCLINKLRIPINDKDNPFTYCVILSHLIFLIEPTKLPMPRVFKPVNRKKGFFLKRFF